MADPRCCTWRGLEKPEHVKLSDEDWIALHEHNARVWAKQASCVRAVRPEQKGSLA